MFCDEEIEKLLVCFFWSRCHNELNPDSYPDMMNVNTQSCEQINKGLKHLAPILNNTTYTRHRLLLLILAHYHNCRQLSIVYQLEQVSLFL